jgi:hypothetical protein
MENIVYYECYSRRMISQFNNWIRINLTNTFNNSVSITETSGEACYIIQETETWRTSHYLNCSEF